MSESTVSDPSGGDGVVRIAIESNGSAIDDSVPVISVHVRHAIGEIASARIELSDSDMDTQRWAVADAAAFAPGAAIRIGAGQGDHKAETIFVGIVVRLGMRIDGDQRSRVVVECRHRAVALTVGRHNRIRPRPTSALCAKRSATGWSTPRPRAMSPRPPRPGW